MTRFLDDLRSSLADLEPLVGVIRKASVSDAAFTYTGIGAGVIRPAVGGVVILLVARFEDYIKTLIDGALRQFSMASPKITRGMLDHQLQLRLARENLQSSWQENLYGTKRSLVTRIQASDAAIARLHAGEIWGGQAISTHGNPGTETLKSLFKIIGGSNDPWQSIEREFANRWVARLTAQPFYKAIPSAATELDNLIGWRNVVAHTSGTLSLGADELETEIAFIDDLSTEIELYVCRLVDGTITRLSSQPAVWP